MNEFKQTNITSSITSSNDVIEIKKTKTAANDIFENHFEAPEGLFDNCDNFKPWVRKGNF